MAHLKTRSGPSWAIRRRFSAIRCARSFARFALRAGFQQRENARALDAVGSGSSRKQSSNGDACALPVSVAAAHAGCARWLWLADGGVLATDNAIIPYAVGWTSHAA